MTKFILAALLMSTSAFATELDPVAVPEEIIVREDATGKREIFKVADAQNISDAETAKAAVAKFVTSGNKVATTVMDGELDRVTSTEAWYYWTYNCYSYNWYGYNYYYQPYYSYNYGYYRYYYYRWF